MRNKCICLNPGCESTKTANEKEQEVRCNKCGWKCEIVNGSEFVKLKY